MAEEPKVYFLTVEWCDNGRRGVFCSETGVAYRKDNEPHTDAEMMEILGLFWVILDPRSEEISRVELEESYTRFIPLAEYSNRWGIAVKPPTEGEKACQDPHPQI